MVAKCKARTYLGVETGSRFGLRGVVEIRVRNRFGYAPVPKLQPSHAGAKRQHPSMLTAHRQRCVLTG
jgi:hypothetical protein